MLKVFLIAVVAIAAYVIFVIYWLKYEDPPDRSVLRTAIICVALLLVTIIIRPETLTLNNLLS